MAKQGELEFHSEREIWSIPYYDLGDVDDLGNSQYIRLSENGNIYEIASWQSVLCSHTRLFFGGCYPPDYSLNNDTVPTVYDSILFDQGEDVIWQNIRKKRDSTNLLYNRLQQCTGSVYTERLEWFSPWVTLGLGEYDQAPYYYEEIPTYSNHYYVYNYDHITDDDDDELCNIDINKSKTLIPIVYYDADQDVYSLELRLIKGYSTFENEETMAWLENPPNKMCISRAGNHVLYEPITMDVGNAVSLNNSDLVNPSVSLETKKDLGNSYAIPDGYNQGALATKYRNGYDYDVDHTNGTVTATDHGEIDDGEECFVNYLYSTAPKIYIEESNNLEQRSIADGDIEWSVDLKNEASVLEGGSDGIYIAINDESNIKKYDRTGSLAWENTNVSGYPNHIKLDNNEDYLYYASNYYLGRIDLSTQAIDWEISLGGDDYAYTNAIELDYNGSYLYISRDSHLASSDMQPTILEVDPTDGTVLRSYPESGDHITVPPPGDTLDPLAFTTSI